jgi:anti-sigma factor RsiW
LTCAEYRSRYLSAHADGELGPEELSAAEAHVGGCEQCRGLLGDERALKKLVRMHAGAVRSPTDLRIAIRGAMERATDSEARTSGRLSALRRSRLRWRSPAVWVPTALAAGIALIVLVPRMLDEGLDAPTAGPIITAPGKGAQSPGSVPEFDIAIAALEQSNQRFEPNVPSGSFAEISNAYLKANMPAIVLNFNPAGFKLVGGRLDELPDGRLVTRTFYRGELGSILCNRFQARGMEAPPGAGHKSGEHHYYNYRGYSICVSFDAAGRFVCVIVSDVPYETFMRRVMFAAGY